MKDPYRDVWESITKALVSHAKMILWIAKRTLSVNDFEKFIDEFAKTEDEHDELTNL